MGEGELAKLVGSYNVVENDVAQKAIGGIAVGRAGGRCHAQWRL